MDYDTMREIVEAITYKPGWTIYFNYSGEGIPYVQIGVDETTEAALDSCSKTGERAPWKGSRRFLSSMMCRQEIVGAVFGLLSDAESHEMREWFRYKGASIYNPHLDPDALVPVAKKKASFSIRENAMTMVEVPSTKDTWRAELAKLKKEQKLTEDMLEGPGGTRCQRISDEEHLRLGRINELETLLAMPVEAAPVQPVATGDV